MPEDKSEKFNQLVLFESDDIEFETGIANENGNDFNYLDEEERQVNIDRSTYSIYEIYRRYKRGDIIIKPFYQRNSVWPNSKKSKLVESVIRNIPIPSFYFAEREDGKWEVVDGQQRLRAFFEFINKEYKLSALPVLTELNKKCFEDLGIHKRKIEDYILHIFIIKQNSHPDIRFDIFERINEGATQLNAQELRNSMYRDGQNDYLRKLSKTPSFVKLTKGKLSAKRLKNEEAVLRFMSFYKKGFENCYNGNMNAFLNDTMENFFKYFSENELENLKNHFNDTMETIFQVLGDKVFIRNNGRVINMSIFDVITYSFATIDHDLILKNKNQIKLLYIYITEENEAFIKSISTNTLAKNTVLLRFNLWMDKLNQIIEEGYFDK